MFETAEIPAVTVNRTAEPNPFDGHFPSDEQALVTVVTGTNDEREKKVKRLVSQAREAAIKVDRTARQKQETIKVTKDGKPSENGSAEATRLTVWTVARITRPRKPAEGEAAPAQGLNNTGGVSE